MYRAVLRQVRISPRKARLVVDLVRGKLATEALDILRVTHKKAAPMISKLIESAVANAKQKSATLDVDQLVVKEARIDPGMMWHRFMPRAQGRAAAIRKRTSHIVISLEEVNT